MKSKLLLICSLPLSLFAIDNVQFLDKKVEEVEKNEVLNTTTYYNIKPKKMLERETKIRNYHSIKVEQAIIKDIIYKFNLLEKSLSNFEEKKEINRLKNQFSDKYLIKQIDVLDINTRLNEVMDK